MGSNRVISFRLSDEQFTVLCQRANSEQISVSQYIKRCLFNPMIENTDDMLIQKEIRDSVCTTEDIVQQLNQDNVMMQRRSTVTLLIIRHMLSKFPSMNEAEVDKLLRKYSDIANMDIPSRKLIKNVSESIGVNK